MDVGPAELGIILVMIILIFGVGKLPEVGSALGKGIREFRLASRQADPVDGGVETAAGCT